MPKPRMTITWAWSVKGVDLVAAPGRPGQAVPRSFTAHVTTDTLAVDLAFEVDEGTVSVTQLVAVGDVRQGALDIDEWKARALDGAAALIRDRVRAAPAGVIDPVTDAEVADGRVWNSLTDEHLREVAEVFNAAEDEPIKEVARRFELTYSTARGRVTTARKRGLLV